MADKVHFQPEPDLFFRTVRERVDAYFRTSGRSTYANPFFYLKALLLLGLYAGMYAVVITTDTPGWALTAMILMGPLAILSGINIAHDAAHGAISRRQWVNHLAVRLFDVLGANAYMWQKRHVYSHHNYPNILNKDADLKQNPLVRIFPHDTYRPAHRYQYLYAPFLYLLYTLNWLYVRDFKDFFARDIGSLHIHKRNTREFVRLLISKAVYVGYVLVVPLLFSVLSWQQVCLGFIGMNMAASIMISLALIPSHVSDHSAFPLPDEHGYMPQSWSHHQLSTITDFATANPFLNFFFGGFNHHLAHHLFPRICHVHCVHITPIIRETAAEFGLPYKHEASFVRAYLAHFRLLRNNGRPSTQQKPVLS